MSKISILKDTIGEYLKENHQGRKNAASSRTLEAVFQLSGRDIRRCVNALRQAGFPLCSDDNGYYYAATQQEINKTITRLNSLITNISSARNGLLNSSLLVKPDIHIEIHLEINN